MEESVAAAGASGGPMPAESRASGVPAAVDPPVNLTVSLAEGENAPRLCVALFGGVAHQVTCFTDDELALWETHPKEAVGPLCEIWIEGGTACVYTNDSVYENSEPLVAKVWPEGDSFVTEWALPQVLPGWVASVALAPVLFEPRPAFDPPERIALPGGGQAGLFRPKWFADQLPGAEDMRLPWWLTVTDESGKFVGSCEFLARNDDGVITMCVRTRMRWDKRDIWVHADGRFWVARAWPPVTGIMEGRLGQPYEEDLSEIVPMLDALAQLSAEQWDSVMRPVYDGDWLR